MMAKTKASSSIKPLADRVLVRPAPAEEVSASGIIIPDTVSKEKPERGVIVAVGEGRRGDDGKLTPMSVKKGDEIVFSKYGFDELKIEGEEYYIVREDNILAVIEKK